MDFVAVMDQVITLLRQRGRLTYRTLQRQFHLDDVAMDDLKEEFIYGQRLAVDGLFCIKPRKGIFHDAVWHALMSNIAVYL
jgi:hypothetical protein